MTAKRHWHEIDWIYTIGILLVIIGHSHSSDWSSFRGSWMECLINLIYSFHMPLFFFIAGFLFWNSDFITRIPLHTWLKQKALRLLIPYCFWTLAALLPKYYLEHNSFRGLSLSYLARTFFCPRDNIWGHFWFIPVLFLLYVIFGVLRVWTKKRPDALFFCAALLLSTGLRLANLKTIFLGLSDLCTNALFFFVGILFCRLLQKLRIRQPHALPKPIGCVVSLLLFCLALLLHRKAGAAPVLSTAVCFCMLGALWCLASALPPCRSAAWIGSHNFTLYLFSWFFQAATMWSVQRFTDSWLPVSALMFLSGLLGAGLTAVAASRMIPPERKSLRLVFGLR